VATTHGRAMNPTKAVICERCGASAESEIVPSGYPATFVLVTRCHGGCKLTCSSIDAEQVRAITGMCYDGATGPLD
jgi:hypothetical protein